VRSAANPRSADAGRLHVGGLDAQVLELNRQALHLLDAKEKELVVVPGATHLFEEPDALEQVARLATDWFTRHLASRADTRGSDAPAIAES
jgi:putative phosphoribosyl transferase